jgi:hypothetical protein
VKRVADRGQCLALKHGAHLAVDEVVPGLGPLVLGTASVQFAAAEPGVVRSPSGGTAAGALTLAFTGAAKVAMALMFRRLRHDLLPICLYPIVAA